MQRSKKYTQEERSLARRRAFLDATWSILIEQGFSALTLDAIIERSGGSRTTVYEEFGSKKGLIETVLAEHCELFADELLISLDPHRPLEEALTGFCNKLLHGIISTEGVRIIRLIAAEGHKFPSIMEKFDALGPDRTRRMLADYLQKQIHMNRLTLTDPSRAAEMLMAMLQGQIMSYLINPDSLVTLTEDEIRKQVQGAVTLFLNGARPR
ncbi:TetR family transcriptional regulator [Sneathiella chinensis]|uniref:TetR family transcriptional regulator n=1 Tax=Sneathiella chinensis TaxID=349750 RepID=A0ABQ5U0B5_9PROT|nr:TetR family transcriptional regulator [Sneathiella chinensis]